jgi:hypothetical protein
VVAIRGTFRKIDVPLVVVVLLPSCENTTGVLRLSVEEQLELVE